MEKIVKQFGWGGVSIIIASVVSLIVTTLLVRLPVFGLIKVVVPEGQDMIKLLFSIIALVISLFIGGYILGYVYGRLIRKKTILDLKDKFAQKIGFSLGITRGLLLIPFLLLIVLISFYNPGTPRSLDNFLILFGGYGAVMGIFSGLLLGLSIAGFNKNFFKVIGATTLSYLVAGLIWGYALFRALEPTAKGEPMAGGVLAVLALIIITDLITGGSLNVVFQNIGFKRSKNKISKKWQRWLLWGIVAFLAIGLISTIWSITNFLKVNDAHLTNQLNTQTIGSTWSTPQKTNTAYPSYNFDYKNKEVGHSTKTYYCNSDDLLVIKGTTTDEKCKSIPSVTTQNNQTHIAWYSDVIKDINGEDRKGNYVLESIYANGELKDPVIVATTKSPVQPRSAYAQSGVTLGWNDSGANYSAIQQNYSCNYEGLDKYTKAIYDAIITGSFRGDTNIPFCGNNYKGMIYMPKTDPAYTNQTETINAGFDEVANLTRKAEYEVLFTVMQWEKNQNNYGPGYIQAQAVADLYKKVKANPEKYPRGMSVKILLGNYPVMANFTWGEQTWFVVEDLKSAGLERMIDEEIGWKVEVANFEGTYPHAHTKFMVIDGKILMTAGFNYNYVHYVENHPSGLGIDLYDLGIVIEGPIAQDAILVYDDMWEGSDNLHCDDLSTDSWENSCTISKSSVSHPAESLRYFFPAGEDESIALYRTTNLQMADAAIHDVVASTEDTIDLYQVNFSLELPCILSLLNKDFCSFEDNSLPYMKASAESIEKNDTKVRVLMERTNMNGMENTVGSNNILGYLKEKGLDGNVEIRYFPGRMHTKGILLDDEFLIIGSQNFHYSAWGDGLSEFSVSTNNKSAIKDFKNLYDFLWDKSIPFEEEKKQIELN